MVRFPGIRPKPKTNDIFRISWTRRLSRPERVSLELDEWNEEWTGFGTLAELEGFTVKLDLARKELILTKRHDFHGARIVVPKHGVAAKILIDVKTANRRQGEGAIRHWSGHLDWLFELLHQAHLIGFEDARQRGERYPSRAEKGA